LSEIQKALSNATSSATEDACTNRLWKAEVKNRLYGLGRAVRVGAAVAMLVRIVLRLVCRASFSGYEESIGKI